MKEEYDIELRCYKDVISHTGLFTKHARVKGFNHYKIGDTLYVTKMNHDEFLGSQVELKKEVFKCREDKGKKYLSRETIKFLNKQNIKE